jgi:uncharacterized protein with ATP-grasp and redox domains
MAEIDYEKSPPELGKELHLLIQRESGNPDPYLEIKQEYNEALFSRYDEFKKRVDTSENPFDTALRFAIAGNIIDFGPGHSIDVDETLDRVLTSDFAMDDSAGLESAIKNAKSILYIGDNAGEIVFDRLFIETINHPNMWFGVRGGPIINDALEADARFVGIDKFAKILSSGDNAPGTILEDTSPEFKRIFAEADLVIAKGQGNYEGLNTTNRDVFFLLMAKCIEVAKSIGVPLFSFLVHHKK